MGDILERKKRTFVYFGFFTKFLFLAWIARDYCTPLLRHLPALQHCDGDGVPDANLCYGREAAFRITLAEAVFFGVLAVVTFRCKENDPRDYFDGHLFGLKYLALWCLLIVAFTLPEASSKAFGECARVGGLIFLVFQVVQVMLRLLVAMQPDAAAQEDASLGSGH